MPFLTVGTNDNDLTLQVPTKRTTDWANEFLDNFVKKIVDHDHTGNGRGKQLGTGAIADNAITSSQILLSDGTALQWQDPDTGNPVDIITFNSNDNTLTVNGDINSSTDTYTSLNEITLNANGSINQLGVNVGRATILHYSLKLDDGVSNLFQTGTIMVDEQNFLSHEYIGNNLIEWSAIANELYYELPSTSDTITIKYVRYSF